MKKAVTILSVILLVSALSLSLAWAKHHDDDDDHGGGLPALERRVEKLEHQVAALFSQVGGLRKDVTILNSVVSSLQDEVATITKSVLNLKGQNNWAVVDSSANVVRHSGANVTAAKMGTGTYEVTFGRKDVTGCAYTATIGDVGKASAAPGFITVSGGVAKTLTDVQVQTFDTSGVATDSAFHLNVSCP